MGVIDLNGHEEFSRWRSRIAMILANQFVAEGMDYRTAHIIAQGLVQHTKGLRALQRKKKTSHEAAEFIAGRKLHSVPNTGGSK